MLLSFPEGQSMVCEMEKIILLAILISAILTMAQFPDWPRDRRVASTDKAHFPAH